MTKHHHANWTMAHPVFPQTPLGMVTPFGMGSPFQCPITFCEEILSDIQPKLPLVQFNALAFYCWLPERIGQSPPSYQAVTESDGVTPEPPFLQVKLLKFPQLLVIIFVLQTFPSFTALV